MQWDWTIKITDIAIVFAALAGPVLAVQAQKWIERKNTAKAERERIFRTLMATRARTVDPAHVEALNAVPIAFYGDARKLKDVRNAWQALMQHFNTAVTSTWAETRINLEMDLLQKIARVLSYDFPDLDMRNVYFPNAHGDILTDQEKIRQGVAKLFDEDGSLRVELRPSKDKDTLTDQVDLRAWLQRLASGKTAFPIEVRPHNDVQRK